MKNKNTAKILFILIIALCLIPYVTAPMALLAGILFSMAIGNPYAEATKKYTHKLLQYSVIGLGFGMNAAVALEAGKSGFIYTMCGIAFTFTVGFLIARMLKVDNKTSFLISAGTAICGGSAIAAVAPVINAKHENTSVALGVVFILNSIALIIFPAIGHYFHLTETQFGIWSAIAIHDTSSVVGASSQYGKLALQTATTIKLARALWIIPVTFASGFIFKSEVRKAKIPYFIFFFIAAMILNSMLPSLRFAFQDVYAVAKQCLVLTLFLIGANLSPASIRSVGLKPFSMGIIIWIIVSVVAFAVI